MNVLLNDSGTFRCAVKAFDASALKLDNFISAGEEVRFPTRYRLGVSRASIVAFCLIFDKYHCDAVDVVSKESLGVAERAAVMFESFVDFSAPIEELKAQAMRQEQRIKDFETATGKKFFRTENVDAMGLAFESLHACYLSFFFLVRAFQDRAYCVLLELCGHRSALHSSMGDGFKDGKIRMESPVGAFLARCCSGYANWFQDFRAMRNDLKVGAPLSTCGPDIGIVVHTFDEKSKSMGGSQRRYTLAEATDAIQWSTRLVDAAMELALQRRTVD